MPSRPDIRELASNVKEAFGDMDRDTLLEILTFVVKEYVVEGPPPMLVHQAETVADLQNLSFAQLIAALQTRFDLPELQLFAVDGDQVSVRVGGVMQPLLGARGGTAPAPAAELPRPAAGVRVVEANLQHQPRPASPGTAPNTPPGVSFVDTRPNAAPPPPAPAQSNSAPPPSRGLSVRGAPASPASPPSAAPSGPSAPAAQPGQPAPPAAANQPAQPGSDKPDAAGGDDASARFSLLELD
jgi:hypothetical protein